MSCSHPMNEYDEQCRAAIIADDVVVWRQWVQVNAWELASDWVGYGSHISDPAQLSDWILNGRLDDGHPLPCSCGAADEMREELAKQAQFFFEKLVIEREE